MLRRRNGLWATGWFCGRCLLTTGFAHFSWLDQEKHQKRNARALLLGWFWLLFFDLQSWRSYNTCTQWNHIKHFWPNACSIIISWYLCNKLLLSLFTILVQAMIPTNLRFSPCALGSGSAFFALIHLFKKSLGIFSRQACKELFQAFLVGKHPCFFLTIILWFYD